MTDGEGQDRRRETGQTERDRTDGEGQDRRGGTGQTERDRTDGETGQIES